MFLGKTRTEADAAYRTLLLANDGHVPVAHAHKLTVAEIGQQFLDHCKLHTAPASYEHYRYFVKPFVDQFGGAAAAELIPRSFNLWLDARKQGSRRNAVIAIKRMYQWAVGEGLLKENPLRSVKKPPARRRERILTADEKKKILAAVKDKHFREFIFALQETGCRPMEVARVTADDVNLEHGVWMLKEHKTARKTGKPRIVYLTPAMIDLTRELVARYPEGPLFRGPREKRPFTLNGIRCRFRRLRKKLLHLAGVVAYTYRHSYATDALANGVPMASVAELMGHRDLSMLQQHYGHLSQKVLHLREAAAKAVNA
jgi:integrase